MIKAIDLKDLFVDSAFFIIKKDQYLDENVQSVISQLHINKDLNRFHLERKKEFLLGRYCAYCAYKLLTGKELLSLDSNEDRSPAWPEQIVGSISHGHDLIICALALKEKRSALGIDIESIGRTKLDLSKHIRIEEDLKSHCDFSEEELLTFIFSAKESLFKALYPEVRKFFGFDYAFVSEISTETNTFKIHLKKYLTEKYNPSEEAQFEGRFTLFEGALITVLEL